MAQAKKETAKKETARKKTVGRSAARGRTAKAAKRGKPRKRAHAIPEELLEVIARRFRTLGVPSRLRILNALMVEDLGMAELGVATGLEQSNLSRQVTELEREGCVVRRKSGRSVRVEIADPKLRELCELVCGALAKRAAPR